MESNTHFRPNREELAWSAGFFDGEGHIRNAGGNRLRMTISQIDRRSLDRVRAALGGLGRVSGPFDRRCAGYQNRRPIWEWNATSFEHAQATAAMLWSFLGPVKREQVERTFRSYRRYTAKWRTCAAAGHEMHTYHYPERKTGRVQHHCMTCRREYGQKYEKDRRVRPEGF